MRRTINDARQHLTDLAPTINPEAYRQFDNEIRTAEADVKQRATGHVDSLYADLLPAARNVSEGLCDVRDTARKLAEQLKAGRISATDAAAELERLRSQSRAQRSSHDEVARRADRMDSIEGDPVAWHSSLAAKFPHMLHDFSF